MMMMMVVVKKKKVMEAPAAICSRPELGSVFKDLARKKASTRRAKSAKLSANRITFFLFFSAYVTTHYPLLPPSALTGCNLF